MIDATAFYLATSSMFSLLMGVIWTKSSWLNAILKIVFISMAAWGLVMTMLYAGFVFRK